MKVTILFVLLSLLCGCAGLGLGREWDYRAPDQDFTVIHSNRGPTTIYRQGNTYWVNSRVQGASGPAYVPAYGQLKEGLTVIHSNRGSTTIYRQGNTYWVNDRRR